MFYLSPSVRPTYKDMEEMIKSAGGIVLRDVPKLTSFTESFTDEYNSLQIFSFSRISLIFNVLFLLISRVFSKSIIHVRIPFVSIFEISPIPSNK